MNPSAKKTIIASVLCASIAGAYWKVSIDARQFTQAKVLSDIEIRKPAVIDHIPAPAPISALKKIDQHSSNSDLRSEQHHALLNAPKGPNHLARDKAALIEYFNNDEIEPTHSPEEVWEMIERIEDDKHVFAFEALSLKLRWLEKNADNDQELKNRSAQLTELYNQKAQAAKDSDTPYQYSDFAE